MIRGRITPKPNATAKTHPKNLMQQLSTFLILVKENHNLSKIKAFLSFSSNFIDFFENFKNLMIGQQSKFFVHKPNGHAKIVPKT